MDTQTLNQMLLGLISQAILEGHKVGANPKHRPDNDTLNLRRVEILNFIHAELMEKTNV